MDNLVLPMMDALLACLCEALAGTPGGEPCSCSLVAGGPPPVDIGCGKGGCGTAWVRLVRTYPSSAYPTQDNTLRSCGVQQAATLEVGVFRCPPPMGSNGSPPSAVEQTQATIVQTADWAAMLSAVRCCEALEKRDPVLGAYEAGGLGAVGGRMTVTVRLSAAPR